MVGFKLFNFTHELLALSLRTRAARHEVLSANIANADTPGYRPKDLDFNAVSLDSQMALLTENSLGYEASLTFLQRALAGLRFAIREGRG